MDDMMDGHLNKEWYIFDSGLPEECPQLLQELVIPRFVTNDFMKRILWTDPENQDAYSGHPSIFVGERGSRGGLHRDSYQSHFWQLLLYGQKEWAVWDIHDKEAELCLYQHGKTIKIVKF